MSDTTTTRKASTTTTYVVMTDGKVTDSRATDTMGYTHARVDADGKAHTWHTSRANAVKANAATPALAVVPVEGHKGGKATVLKRLAANAEDVAKAAPAKAKKAKAPAKEQAVKAPKAPSASATAPEGHPGRTWMSLVEKAGQTRMAVAKAMGVAPMTLHRLIAGQGVPTAAMTVRFAATVTDLGYPVDVQALWAEVAAYELKVALAK